MISTDNRERFDYYLRRIPPEAAEEPAIPINDSLYWDCIDRLDAIRELAILAHAGGFLQPNTSEPSQVSPASVSLALVGLIDSVIGVLCGLTDQQNEEEESKC